MASGVSRNVRRIQANHRVTARRLSHGRGRPVRRVRPGHPRGHRRPQPGDVPERARARLVSGNSRRRPAPPLGEPGGRPRVRDRVVEHCHRPRLPRRLGRRLRRRLGLDRHRDRECGRRAARGPRPLLRAGRQQPFARAELRPRDDLRGAPRHGQTGRGARQCTPAARGRRDGRRRRRAGGGAVHSTRGRRRAPHVRVQRPPLPRRVPRRPRGLGGHGDGDATRHPARLRAGGGVPAGRDPADRQRLLALLPPRP